MSFLNFAMLAGLAGVAIPPIIHLLNRRRYDVVDWGAMQFLQVSEITRRRLLIEELLLMLLRMGLIAVLVLALAGPFSDNSPFSSGQRTNRDVVLIFDGSASMTFKGSGKSAQEQAKEWATTFVNGLAPGDSVAIVVARKQPLLPLGKLTTDFDRVRNTIAKLPEPSGSCDWPRAVQAAYAVLEQSQRSEREIVLISDGQRFSFADRQTLLGWEDLAGKHNGDEIQPRLWVANLDPKRPEKPANWALAPITASRAVVPVKDEVTFRTALQLTGQTRYEPPYEIRLEVDGQFVTKIDAPREAKLEGGQVPLTFTHRFPKAGSHLVTLIVEPDLPPELRKPGYVVKDHLPIDNRRDFALEVVEALPVLLVDGDDTDEPKNRGSDFLRDALAPARDRTPAVRVKVVPVKAFTAALLKGEPKEGGADKTDDRPRVIIFCNVARLSDDQQKAVEQFLQEGGGVLVTLGDRAEPGSYNGQLFREGEGWLPARLDKVLGDDNDVKGAARPLPSTFFHPALEMFRKPSIGGLDGAWFARWWKVVAPSEQGGGGVVARLNRGEAPFLVEKRRGEGRVLLCTVPLDTSWRTNLFDLPAFTPFAHELVYYLAGARAADHNLDPGQPLRYRLPRDATSVGLALQAPSDTEPKPLLFEEEEKEGTYAAKVVQQALGPLLIHEGMRETGIWKLTVPQPAGAAEGTQTVYYAVQTDPNEADLTPVSDADRKKVGKFMKFTYENDAPALLESLSKEGRRQEFWWWFLLGVIALLCGEVWFTRRLVKSRA
jgi:hypothetical protein